MSHRVSPAFIISLEERKQCTDLLQNLLREKEREGIFIIHQKIHTHSRTTLTIHYSTLSSFSNFLASYVDDTY